MGRVLPAPAAGRAWRPLGSFAHPYAYFTRYPWALFSARMTLKFLSWVPLRPALLLGLAGCAALASPTTAAAQAFAKGADVGWLQQMEATGYVFHNAQGQAQDCFAILKAQGINSIRLRVFVNPSDDKASGHCSPAEVVAMARRGRRSGLPGHD